MIGKSYISKLPSGVVAGMKQLSEDDCFLVKRRVSITSDDNAEHNSHRNVQNKVDSLGGKRISGWLLIRKKELIDRGVYIWLFHSVWQTPDGECFDTTQNALYENSEAVTFWLDTAREADLSLGTSYNSVIVLADEMAVKAWRPNIQRDLEAAKPYWTDDTVTMFVDFEMHSGVYRILNKEYPKNLHALTTEYDCTISLESGKIAPNKPGANLPFKVYFDYAIS